MRPPPPELFNNLTLLLLRSQALNWGGVGGTRRPKGRGRRGVLLLGLCSPHSRRRLWAARPVLLTEGSQSWRVKSLRACVIPAAQASSGGGGVGEGEGAVCVKREVRA